MVMTNGFQALSLEATQQQIKDLIEITNNNLETIAALQESVLTLVQMVANLTARKDVASRMIVNGSEVTQPVSGTVTATVANATVTTVSNITAISGQQLPFIGFVQPAHIYNNIEVT